MYVSLSPIFVLFQEATEKILINTYDIDYGPKCVVLMRVF